MKNKRMGKILHDMTHIDEQGNALMVDVGQKDATSRLAVARGQIKMSPQAYENVRRGAMGKGDVLGVARVAGIMAVKQTPALIPLCHTLLVEKTAVEFDFHDEKQAIIATCTVKTSGKTGAEMEALTGASVALLTIYDMCKAIDKDMVIADIHLAEKSGGKSGMYKSNRGIAGNA